MAKLAQAYVHLRLFEVTEGQLNELGHATEAIAAEVAQRVYRREIFIDVELEGGSLKCRVTAIGLLFAAYGVIADYKGFKDSITEMCKDAREYAYDVCGEVIKITGASKNEIVSVQRRPMTPGRLSRVIERLERLDAAGGTLNERQRHQEMQKILQMLEAIKSGLTAKEVDLLDTVLEYRHLPPSQQAPLQVPEGRPDMPRVGITPAKRLRYHNRIVVPAKT
jgi:hypothetical protein